MNLADLKPIMYRRMSEDTQDNSPARQAQVVKEWSRQSNVPLIDPNPPFLDEAITGTTNDRFHLKRLINTGHQLGGNAVAIDQMSRISRTDALEAAAEVYLPLRQAGLRYIIDCSKNTVHDLYDTNCILFVTIEQGHGSHAESKNIAHRVASGMKTLKDQGYYLGKKAPDGYRIVDRRKNKFGEEGCGKLQIIPEDAPKYLQVFRLYLKLRSAPKVGRELGIPAYKVQKILSNPIYCGRQPARSKESRAKFESMDAKRQPGDKRKTLLKKDEMEYRDNVFPAIVSPAEWDRCQAIMKENRKNGTKRQFRGFKYKGKIICADCGCKMHGQWDTSKGDAKRKVVYLCASYSHEVNPPPGHCRCQTPRRIKESLIDAALGECLDHIFGETGGIEEWKASAEEAWEQVQLRIRAARKQREADKAALELRKSQAARSLLLLAGSDPEIIEAAKGAYAELLKEEKAIEADLKQSYNEEAERKANLEHVQQLWYSACQGEVSDLVASIRVRFEPLTRISRRWINKRGEARGQREYTKQIPTFGLIEFRTFTEEANKAIPISFYSIVSTSADGQPSVLNLRRSQPSSKYQSLKPCSASLAGISVSA